MWLCLKCIIWYGQRNADNYWADSFGTKLRAQIKGINWHVVTRLLNVVRRESPFRVYRTSSAFLDNWLVQRGKSATYYLNRLFQIGGRGHVLFAVRNRVRAPVRYFSFKKRINRDKPVYLFNKFIILWIRTNFGIILILHYWDWFERTLYC